MKATNSSMNTWLSFPPYRHCVINFLLFVLIFQQFCCIIVESVVSSFGNTQQPYGEQRNPQSQSQLQQQHLNPYSQAQYSNQQRQPQYHYNENTNKNYPTSYYNQQSPQDPQWPQEEIPRQSYYNRNRNQQAIPVNIQQNMRSGGPLRSKEHKILIWIPTEALDKYPLAVKRQDDKVNQLLEIEVCSPGYAPVGVRSNFSCRAVCENCQNGYCIEPDNCQCYEGFVSNDNGDCVFTCPLGCLNGICYLDGTCQCKSGYKLDETRKFCRPICRNGCGNNERYNCTEPDVCACSKNFQLTDGRCQPTCDPDCGANGSCSENHECLCNPGYNFKDGTCQADCYQKCSNGICYSKNRCICKPGYVYHERSTHCVPK